jgi:hypothetical protein
MIKLFHNVVIKVQGSGFRVLGKKKKIRLSYERRSGELRRAKLIVED